MIMNFIDLVLYVCSFVSLTAAGVVMGSIVISLDEKRREKQAMQEIKQPLLNYTQKTDKQLEAERMKRDRAEHNVRVLRQYKIKD
jgi:biopolymer transport protein ExbD